MSRDGKRDDRRRPGVAIAGAVAYAAVATSFGPYTWPIRVATGLPAATALVVAVRRGWLRRRLPVSIDPRRRALVVGIAVWMVLISLAVALQLLVYFASPRELYPTLSSLAEHVFSSHGVRAASFAAWLWLGWFLLDR